MLRLDPYSESVLFQCDRCRWVGELFTDLLEEEGTYHCWSCLREMNRAKVRKERSEGAYAAD